MYLSDYYNTRWNKPAGQIRESRIPLVHWFLQKDCKNRGRRVEQPQTLRFSGEVEMEGKTTVSELN